MRHVMTGLVALAATLGWCGSALAQDQVNVEDLKKQRGELEAKVKDLNGKVQAARAAIEKQDELVNLAKATASARKALADKSASDQKIGEAKKAGADAEAAANKVAGEEVAAAPEYAALKKEIGEQTDVADESESQQRIANFILGEIRRKVGKNPEIAKLTRAAEAAGAAARGKAADSPEKQAAAAAAKALEDAVKPKMAEKGADQLRKIEEQGAKAKAAGDVIKAAEGKLAELRKTVLAKSEKYAAARKAADAARDSARKIEGEQTAAEKEAVGKAQKVYDDALSAKMSADATVTQARKELEDASAKTRELGSQIRKAEAKK